MQERRAQLNKFKEKFQERLAAFMEKRSIEIGDPAQWILRGVAFPPGTPAVLFKKANDNPQHITFTLSDVPENLSAEERNSLRRYINDACADKGFEPYRPRDSLLPPEVFEGIRKLDSDAWTKFVGKHRTGLTAYADKLLNDGGNQSLIEPEDVVYGALGKLFLQYANNHITTAKSPQPIIYQLMFSHVRDLKNSPSKLRKQSGDGDYERLVQPEYGGQAEMVEEQLPAILKTARELMTPRQKEVLEAIIDNERSGGGLSIEELAKRIGVTKQRIYQHLDNIAVKIKEAAGESGFEETAAVIDRLVRINTKERTASI